MRVLRTVLACSALALLGAFASIAQAQTTRVTPCDAATPNNAICVTSGAPTTNTDGTTITLPLVYRVEQKAGAGSFGTVANGLTTAQYYAKNLAPGTYLFRVYANCVGVVGVVNCNESAASNVGTRDVPVPTVTPNPPIITIAVVISPDVNIAPVYRIVSGKRGELFGFVPEGRECTGPVVFRYRGASFRLVNVNQEELWGTKDASNLAAPCAASGA